jgi:hypothetical protein
VTGSTPIYLTSGPTATRSLTSSSSDLSSSESSLEFIPVTTDLLEDWSATSSTVDMGAQQSGMFLQTGPLAGPAAPTEAATTSFPFQIVVPETDLSFEEGTLSVPQQASIYFDPGDAVTTTPEAGIAHPVSVPATATAPHVRVLATTIAVLQETGSPTENSSPIRPTLLPILVVDSNGRILAFFPTAPPAGATGKTSNESLGLTLSTSKGIFCPFKRLSSYLYFLLFLISYEQDQQKLAVTCQMSSHMTSTCQSFHP